MEQNYGFDLKYINDLDLSDQSPEYKEELISHLNQAIIDPSFIGNIENPNIFRDLSRIFDITDDMEKIDKRSSNQNFQSTKREFPNETYRQHYKDYDNTTKQYNPQMKQKRNGGEN